MKTKILFLIFSNFFLFSITIVKGQDIDFCREVILVNEDQEKSSYHVYDYLESKRKLKKELTYFTFYKDTIFQTQGSYYGHLLHGPMRVFFSNEALRMEGHFLMGLKHGTWLTWNNSGKLAAVETWKHGKRHGTFESYDKNGMLQLKGKYKKGLLKGAVSKYENGKLQSEEEFKKEDKTNNKKKD